MRCIIALLTIICFSVLFSCRSSFQAQYYKHVVNAECDSCDVKELKGLQEGLTYYGRAHKRITIESDSVLVCSVLYGGIGISTEMNYSFSTDTTIVATTDFLEASFLFYRDSLIDQQTNEKYYNERYLKKVVRKRVEMPTRKTKVFIIWGDEVVKVTKSNSKRKYKELDIINDRYQSELINDPAIKKQYGIKEKYLVFKLIEKNTDSLKTE